MMTEVLHQKVRPRRSTAGAVRSRRRPLHAFFEHLLSGLVPTAHRIRKGFRSLLWKKRIESVRLHRPHGTTGAFRLGAVLARMKPGLPLVVGGGVLLLFFGFFIFGGTLSSLWARDWGVSLPEEGEIESLLLAYVEPPASEILDGEIHSVDPSRFSALSISSHRIGQGETISGIAMKAGLNLDTVISLNRIEDVRRVPVGVELKLPNQNGILYTVRRGDSLSSISTAFNVSMNALADVNNIDSSVIHPGQDLFIPGARMKQMELKKILGELFIYPTVGRLTSGFGPRNDPFTGVRRFHNGVDIAGPAGTPIHAAMAGRIAKIGVHPSYGRYIIMTHSSGYQTWYAHLQKAILPVGATVAQGEMIGEMGNTGYSTGTHLHFSIFKNGSPVDPMRFLR